MVSNFLSFSGLLQCKTSSFLRKADQLIQSINVNGDEVGSLTQRLGYTTYGGAIGASAINGLYTYPTSSTEYLFGYQNGNLIYNSGTWQVAQAGLLANAKPEFREFIGQLYMVGGDGTNYLTTAVITGTTYSTGGNVTNAPTGDSIELFADQLWISKGSKIYPSSIPDVAGTTITWDTTNDYKTVYTPNGESIITLHNNQALNKLLIFKTSTLHAWDGYRILDLAKVGTSARRSVATVDNVTFFYNKYKNKIYAYTGAVTKGISRPIDKWLKGIQDKDAVFAIDEENEFYKLNVGSVVVDGRTYSNCEIRYAMLDNTFTIYSYHDTFSVYAKHNVSGVQRIYSGATGYVYQLAKTGDTVYSDNTHPISAEFMFETDFGDPANRKFVDKIMIYSTRAQNLKGRIKGRNDKDWATNFQVTKDEMDVNVNPRDSRFMQFHFSSSSTVAPFIWEGLSLTPKLSTKRYV